MSPLSTTGYAYHRPPAGKLPPEPENLAVGLVGQGPPSLPLPAAQPVKLLPCPGKGMWPQVTLLLCAGKVFSVLMQMLEERQKSTKAGSQIFPWVSLSSFSLQAFQAGKSFEQVTLGVSCVFRLKLTSRVE